MKHIIRSISVIWLTTSCCIADVAVESLKLPEVTAEVMASVWRSSFDYTIATYEDDGKQHETGLYSESGWFLSLRYRFPYRWGLSFSIAIQVCGGSCMVTS